MDRRNYGEIGSGSGWIAMSLNPQLPAEGPITPALHHAVSRGLAQEAEKKAARLHRKRRETRVPVCAARASRDKDRIWANTGWVRLQPVNERPS